MYDGEYRGFYPSGEGGGKWDPASSRFDGRAGNHRALDIYAPYAPHPNETPLLALADGELTVRYGDIEPNGVGNRAEIAFGENKKLSYGHLSRFEGRNRRVERGDVIGFAGCSGNADTQGECSSCGVCRINSGHVHLIEFEGANKIDPLSDTGLALRFTAGDPLAARVSCREWIETEHARKTDWEPAPPDEALSLLRGRSEMNWFRSGGKRSVLPNPFQLLEFDDTGQLLRTRDFYEVCKKRVEKLADPPPGLRDFLVRVHRDARAALGPDAKAQVDAMLARIMKDGAVIGLGDDPAQEKRVPGWLLRHISVLSQMFWTVCGGGALNRLASNVAGDAGDARYQAQSGLADLRQANPAECGASLFGIAYLSGTSYARNALHLTAVEHVDAAGAKRLRFVWSVTFGAGSMMHATVSERMKEPSLGGTNQGAEMERKIADYLDALDRCGHALMAVHRLAYQHQVLLSEGGIAIDADARKAALEELRRPIDPVSKRGGAIPLAIAALQECAEAAAGDPALAAALVDRFAQSNACMFAELVTASRQKENEIPFCPSLLMLTATEPEKAPSDTGAEHGDP